MSYCPECGKEIKGNPKFCTECGSNLNNEKDMPAVPLGQIKDISQPTKATISPEGIDKKDKSSKKKLFAGIIGLIIIVVVLLIAYSLNNHPEPLTNQESQFINWVIPAINQLTQCSANEYNYYNSHDYTSLTNECEREKNLITAIDNQDKSYSFTLTATKVRNIHDRFVEILSNRDYFDRDMELAAYWFTNSNQTRASSLYMSAIGYTTTANMHITVIKEYLQDFGDNQDANALNKFSI